MWENCKRSAASKKGDPSDSGNYWHIASCSNLAKVMESILNHKLMKYREDNSLLNDRQYSFWKNRSTGDLMSLLTETWNRSVHFLGCRFGYCNVKKYFWNYYFRHFIFYIFTIFQIEFQRLLTDCGTKALLVR